MACHVFSSNIFSEFICPAKREHCGFCLGDLHHPQSSLPRCRGVLERTPGSPFYGRLCRWRCCTSHTVASQRFLQTGQRYSGCSSLASLPSLDSSSNPTMPSHPAHIHHPQAPIVKSQSVPPSWHHRSSKTPRSNLSSEEIQTLISTEMRIHLLWQGGCLTGLYSERGRAALGWLFTKQ